MRCVERSGIGSGSLFLIHTWVFRPRNLASGNVLESRSFLGGVLPALPIGFHDPCSSVVRSVSVLTFCRRHSCARLVAISLVDSCWSSARRTAMWSMISPPILVEATYLASEMPSSGEPVREMSSRWYVRSSNVLGFDCRHVCCESGVLDAILGARSMKVNRLGVRYRSWLVKLERLSGIG